MKKLLLILTLAVASCVGPQKAVREHGLMPAAALAWGSAEYGVQSDVLRGIGMLDSAFHFDAVNQMTVALEQRDIELLRTAPWAMLHPFAVSGIQDRIDDGEMIPAAAVFLTRRLEQFDIAVHTLVAPMPITMIRTSRAPQPLKVEIQ